MIKDPADNTTDLHGQKGNISLIFSSNFEEDASESPENIEEILPIWAKND